jgi:hypothetical protein
MRARFPRLEAPGWIDQVPPEPRSSLGQRALDLAKANEALRSCLDALASVPDLDQSVGQVMAVMTGQLGAASAALALFNGEHKTSQVETALPGWPGNVSSRGKLSGALSINTGTRGALLAMLSQPITVIHLSDPQAPGIVLLDG